MVQCLYCKHGSYKQWYKNPIICICDELEEKFVAESKRVCKHYEERPTPPEIEHFDHY